MSAHAHPDDENSRPGPITNVSVNFTTGRVDYTPGHCRDLDSFQYRLASGGAWTTYDEGNGCYTDPGSQPYSTASAITGRDYVEARMETTDDAPHCGGGSIYTAVIAYARTTLVTNRGTLHGGT